MAMKLHTGKVAFPIEFDNGDKDCIYFNPNDPDLAARLIASRDKIQSRIDTMEFEDFEISNSGLCISNLCHIFIKDKQRTLCLCLLVKLVIVEDGYHI